MKLKKFSYINILEAIFEMINVQLKANTFQKLDAFTAETKTVKGTPYLNIH